MSAVNLLKLSSLNAFAQKLHNANLLNKRIQLMDIANVEVKRFLKSLDTQKVEYMLVGGMAVAFHGHVRATQDLDLWVKEGLNNKKKLVNALKNIDVAGAEYYQNIDMVPGWSTINIGDEGFEADLMGYMKVFKKEDFDTCYSRAVKSKISDVSITVISLNDLIKEKKGNQRGKDIADLEALEKINQNKTRMTKAEASARKYQENKALADRFVENISIADYLLSKGFIKVRGEKNLYQSEALGRKIHVNTKGREELCFDVLNGKIGNIINLVRKLEDCTFPQAIEHLKNYNPALALTYAPAPKRQKEPKVTIEGHADKYQDEFKTTKAIDLSAFKKHRGIDANVLESPIFKDTVKFYKRENKYGFAFPILNGEHKVGLHVKNLLLDRKETVKHSLRGEGLGHSNLSVNPTKICVTEDPIDAMSHWVLNGKPANIAYFYTFGRPTPEQYELILNHQKKLGNPGLIIGFDNDFYGMRYCHELAQRRLPKGQRQDSHEALQYDKEKEVYTWKGKAYENTRENRTKTITEIQKLSGADFEVHTPITKDFNDDLNKNLINKYINKMKEVNKNKDITTETDNKETPEEKVKSETIKGFLVRPPKLKTKDGKDNYSFQVVEENSEGISYKNIKVSQKIAEGLNELKVNDYIQIHGFKYSYPYKDDEGNKQIYEFLQAGKPIKKVERAEEISKKLERVLERKGDKAKVEVITGYLPQEVREYTIDDDSKCYYFSVATKTDAGETDYKNVRVSAKVSEGADKLKVADRVEVVAFPMERSYKDAEGNEKNEKYYQAAKPVEKIMDQKISIEGHLGDDVKVQSYENGDKAYFSIAVKKEGSEETKWYNASAGSKFFDRESLPEKGDLIKVTGYVQKSSNPKFNDTLRVAESIEVKIKKGVRLENEEKKKTQGSKMKL